MSDRSGSVAIQVGLVSVVLMACAGAAIDYNRWHTAKRITADAVDAAVLAGVRALQLQPDAPSNALLVAKRFYDQNTQGKVDLYVNTIDFVMADNNQAITATGAATMKTALLSVIGIPTLPVLNTTGSGFAKAKLSVGGPGGSNIEISLMLDVTGSMCNGASSPCTSSAKLDGLKSAAKQLVDMVISADQSKYTSKMALVPFAARVRVGPDGGGGGLMKALTDLDPVWSGYISACLNGSGDGGNEGIGNWSCSQYETQLKSNWKIMPCVTDRFYDSGNVFDATDDAPGSNTWLNAHDGTRMTRSWDSSNTTPGSYRGQSAADPATHWNYDPTGECAEMAQANQILPLTSDRSLLKSRIDGLVARGSTAGALGTAWTWYMLSPKWASIWTGDSRPAPYADLTTQQPNGRPLLRKVAILMSDGVFNTLRSWKDQNQQQVSNYAKQVCTNMKAQGIEIFTVALALNELSTSERLIAEDTLRSCGTDVKHFYSTLTPEELTVAFQDIGAQLSSVYLSR